MLRIMMVILFAACFATLAPEAQAQLGRRGRPAAGGRVTPELGPRVGYDFEADDWSVGGQLRVPASRLETLLSGDYYFAAGTRQWQLNLDLALRLGRLSSLYAGGGIGILHALTTDVGPNMLVGLHPPARRGSPVRPYAEGRWTFFGGDHPFRLVFGVNLMLGR